MKTARCPWRDTPSGVSRQFYSPPASSIACAVVFGYRRVILATRVLWRIEYHYEAKPNNITTRRAISLFAKQRISLIESRKERVMRKCNSVKRSLLLFIASFAMPIPLFYFSDKNIIHCGGALFCTIGNSENLPSPFCMVYKREKLE